MDVAGARRPGLGQDQLHDIDGESRAAGVSQRDLSPEPLAGGLPHSGFTTIRGLFVNSPSSRSPRITSTEAGRAGGPGHGQAAEGAPTPGLELAEEEGLPAGEASLTRELPGRAGAGPPGGT